MLSPLQKTFGKVFNYIIFNTQSKRVFLNQEFAAPKDIMRFGATLFVRSTGSRHLREMKTSVEEAPFNFSEMVNGHF